MPPFGHPLGDQNPTKNRSKTGLLLMSLQDRPKIAQDPPKRAPSAPKTPPRPPQDPQKCSQQAPDTPRRVQKRSQNSAAGTWDRDRQTSFPVCHQRGVIPKAGGAAGDSAAGVLDPAAPPRWGRVETTGAKSSSQKLPELIRKLSLKSLQGVQFCRRPSPLSVHQSLFFLLQIYPKF